MRVQRQILFAQKKLLLKSWITQSSFLGFADLLVVLKESLGQEPELEDVDLPVGGVQHVKHVPHHLDPPARQLKDLSCGLVVDEEPGEETTLDANLLTPQPPNLI